MLKEPKRYFTVGSEWLYYKLYVGPQTSENLLITILKPIAAQLLHEKIIDKWFFINYADPHRHIRIRFHVVHPKKQLNTVIQTLDTAFAPYIMDKLINDVQVTMYKRELERYGKSTIEEFETLFYLNSKLTLNLLEHIAGDPEKRWLWCLKTLDHLMDDWNLTLENKKNLFELLKISFGEEMGATTSIRKQLSTKFRKKRASIIAVMENPPAILKNTLSQFSEENIPIVHTILEKKKLGLLDNQVDKLQSYIHMHCNRFFNSKQRMNEWVIYDFLYQYYRSRIAQNKNTK